MHGYGRSVFSGTKIETFKITVLGVLKKIDFGGDMILIRVDDGPPVKQKTGISAGMSGSPVYIDGKIVGAIAFAWPFAKEPVAGVTPIRQMLEAYEPGASGQSVPPSGRAESTPRSPRTAAAISASAGRQVRTTSLAAATAAGSATRRPPASARVLAAASRRVQKVSS